MIAGVGRAGSSFLVQLLHECGLETHLSRPGGSDDWYLDANAGLEDSAAPGGKDLPYVVKSPLLHDWLGQVGDDFHIDGVIVPIRELDIAAASRAVIEVQAKHRSDWSLTHSTASPDTSVYTPGGLVYSLHPLDEARVLAVSFYRLLYLLTQRETPIALVEFPRLISDPGYLYRHIGRFIEAFVSPTDFAAAHARIADEQKVRTEEENPTDPMSVEVAALKRELARMREVNELQTRRLAQLEKKDVVRPKVVTQTRESRRVPTITLTARLRRTLTIT